MKNLRYWPANIKGDVIDAHFALKVVGNFDAVKQVESGVAYHVLFMKEPYYVIKIMTTCGTLEPTYNRTWRKFKRVGVMETKEFMYTEVVANQIFY